MTTLKQLQESGDWQIFQRELIIKAVLIKVDDKYVEDFYGETYQIVNRVYLIKYKDRTVVPTTQGPITETRLSFLTEHMHVLSFSGPYIYLFHQVPVEIQKTLEHFRHNMWIATDIEPYMNRDLSMAPHHIEVK